LYTNSTTCIYLRKQKQEEAIATKFIALETDSNLYWKKRVIEYIILKLSFENRNFKIGFLNLLPSILLYGTRFWENSAD
jgi:hypothetical protein